MLPRTAVSLLPLPSAKYPRSCRYIKLNELADRSGLWTKEHHLHSPGQYRLSQARSQSQLGLGIPTQYVQLTLKDGQGVRLRALRSGKLRSEELR